MGQVGRRLVRLGEEIENLIAPHALGRMDHLGIAPVLHVDVEGRVHPSGIENIRGDRHAVGLLVGVIRMGQQRPPHDPRRSRNVLPKCGTATRWRRPYGWHSGYLPSPWIHPSAIRSIRRRETLPGPRCSCWCGIGSSFRGSTRRSDPSIATPDRVQAARPSCRYARLIGRCCGYRNPRRIGDPAAGP